MEVEECIRTRRSIRKYLDVPVPRALYTKVADAGRLAPSAGNLQNWRFIILYKKSAIKQIAEACMQQYWMETAPILIVLIAEPDKSKRYYGIRGERLYATQNLAAATENMLLMAHALGLGACWVGAFDEDAVRAVLNIPEEYRPQAIITLGYPDEKVPMPSKYPLEIVCYFNHWRGRIEDVNAMYGFHSVRTQQNIQKGKEMLSKGIKKLGDKGRDIVKKIRKDSK